MQLFVYTHSRHVGYCNESLLPFNRGFKTGLYSHMGLQYHSRQTIRQTPSSLDAIFGEPSYEIRQLRRQYLGRNYLIRSHDTYRIDNYIETPAFIEDGLSSSPSYNEDLYTQNIKSYIASQNGSNPFFVYYSQWVCMFIFVGYIWTNSNAYQSLFGINMCYTDTAFFADSATSYKT